jgi:hypothetical protein
MKIVLKKYCSGAVAALCMTFVAGNVVAAYSIPAEQLEASKVYYGSANDFENPAKIQYESIIKATPEYDEVRTEKIARGTGRYWVLLSKAADRANRAIQHVGDETEYDLIALSGYLSGLEPAIEADDITDMVIEAMSASAEEK